MEGEYGHAQSVYHFFDYGLYNFLFHLSGSVVIQCFQLAFLYTFSVVNLGYIARCNAELLFTLNYCIDEFCCLNFLQCSQLSMNVHFLLGNIH